MEFEFIDEDQIEFSRKPKEKKTPSLYDTPIADRTYWGNDPGTEIAMALARIQIRKYIKNLKLMDVDDHDLTRGLLKRYRDELRDYQLEMLKVLITQDKYIIVQNDDGEMELEIIYPEPLVDDSLID